MKIIAYEASRVTVLFPYEEVIPLTGVNDREITEKIAARYKFVKSPSLIGEETAKNGYRFEIGQIATKSGPERIADFSIFRDGIVINSTKTDGAEALLDDITQFMKSEFGYRDPVTLPLRYFQSQIVVEFDKSPAKLIASLDKIAAILSEPLKNIYGIEIPMQFGRLDLAADQRNLPIRAMVQNFLIERRLNISFDNERYFCSAPLQTAVHVEVLEKLEALLV